MTIVRSPMLPRLRPLVMMATPALAQAQQLRRLRCRRGSARYGAAKDSPGLLCDAIYMAAYMAAYSAFGPYRSAASNGGRATLGHAGGFLHLYHLAFGPYHSAVSNGGRATLGHAGGFLRAMLGRAGGFLRFALSDHSTFGRRHSVVSNGACATLGHTAGFPHSGAMRWVSALHRS
jgi:hypothetical protein